MFARLVWEDRAAFAYGRWPWFFPLNRRGALEAYLALREGADPWKLLEFQRRPLGDQLPFVMHLWQGGAVTLGGVTKSRKRPSPRVQEKLASEMPWEHLRVGLVAVNRAWRDPQQPFRAVHDGLVALGAEVRHSIPSPWPLFGEPVDLIILWNGVKKDYHYREIVDKAREVGIAVLIMEHGFFRRRDYTQIDPAGFAHRAGWVSCFGTPPPTDGRDRFCDVWGQAPALCEDRDGYVLVLLQVPGDAQLGDSEIEHPGPLVKAVEAACPDDVDIRVRAHPRCNWSCGTEGRARMLGGTLAEAMRGA
ncbi:unnamed protein product, partial [marine sediment metagenome]